MDEFKEIKDDFNSLNIKFMYDTFDEGANSDLFDLLENEFGIIATQDIISFNELRDMYERININNKKTEVDGTVRGIGVNIESQLDDDRNKNQSVFEKLISNAQLNGIRRSSLTREKPIIQPLSNGIKVDDVIKNIQNTNKISANDLL